MNKLINQKQSIFITPNIQMFDNLEDLRKDKREYEISLLFDRSKKTSIENLFDNRLSLLIGEPGFGKTYLLQKIIKLAELQKPEEAIFAELKSFTPNDTVETVISRGSGQLGVIKTVNFELQNSDNVIICLDGLDEIRQDLFSEGVEKIKEFLNKYRNISLILSCRFGYYQKWPVFEGKKFKIIKLYPFSLEDTRDYLQKSNVDKEKIELIFKKLKFQNRRLIIQVPRYLSLLVEYVNNNPDVDLSQISRSELFEYFIYKKLEKEDKVLNQEKRNFIKRVLEKLALIMEIYQTNEISKDELMTFFDDIRSNLSSVLLSQIPIETFYDKSLIRDDIQSISFENPEFQEYLASKELLHLGRIEKTLYDIVVDKELQEIHPSWFNTLTFLLEQEPDLFDKMLDFGLRETKMVIDDEYTKLLLKVDYERVDKETRRAMFKEILTHYQEREELWLDWEIAEGLSPFYDDTLSTFLKSWIDGRKNRHRLFVKRANVARIVDFLLINRNLCDDDRQYWREKLIRFANDTNENGVLQRRALFALRQLKDSSLIKKVENTWKHRQELVRREFLKFCYAVDANHELSIEYFVRGTKENFLEARYGICEISNKKGMKKLLESFKNDPLFFHHFVDQESVFRDKDKKIIKNVRSILDDEIAKLVFDVLIKAFESEYSYDAEESTFITNLALLLKGYDRNLLFTLISRIKRSKKLQSYVFVFQNMFASALDKNQVEAFVNRLSQLKHGKMVALHTLQQIKFSDRTDKEEIYEGGRKYLDKEYDESEKFWKKHKRKVSEETRLYKEFQDKLKRLTDEIQKKSNIYHFGVLAEYLNVKDRIKITDKDENDLKDIVIFVFEKFDPRDGYGAFRIDTRNAGAISITWHSWTPVFANCVKLGSLLKLNIDVSKYRQKIINFIPFAHYEEYRAIFELIKNVKPGELNDVLAIYKSDSDLRTFQPKSFIEFIKEYRLKEGVSIAKEFIKEEKLSIHERKEALRLTELLEPNKNFLEKTFREHKGDKDESFQLSESANELLIENYRDEKAIRWRFAQLKERIFEFEESRDVHSVGFLETELDEKKFATPLMRLKDASYTNEFLDLLDFSFKKVSENRLYWSYTQYLWEIVVSYFDNLKYARSYEPIKQLERLLQNRSNIDYSNWFKAELKKLKRSYIVYIGKPTSITDAIKVFNDIGSRQYLPIATPEELCDAVMKAINEDLRNWIENEGGSRILRNKREPEIQRILRLALENILLKRGFDFQIYREPQLLDDKRVDFLINYGFIGQILLELKLSSHSDLQGSNLENKKSFRNLQQYMKGFSVKYGILTVIDDAEVDDDKLRRIRNSYSKIENLRLSEPLKLHKMG